MMDDIYWMEPDTLEKVGRKMTTLEYIEFLRNERNRYKKFAGDAIKLLKEIEWRNDDCNQCVCCLGF